jgi:hypothetical protein
VNIFYVFYGLKARTATAIFDACLVTRLEPGGFTSEVLHLIGDRSVFASIPVVRENVLHVHVDIGKASAHHLFPSNWFEISDMVVAKTGVYALLVAAAVQCLGRNDSVGACAYYTVGWTMASVLSHKYVHERNHGRRVPSVYRWMQDLGLFMSPDTHRSHHLDTSINYSLLNGVTSGILESFLRWVGPGQHIDEHALLASIRNTQGISRIKFTGDVDYEVDYHQ